MKTNTHKSARCPVCGATVIVWRRPGVAARLLRKLALADHVRVLHAPPSRRVSR